MRPAGARRRAVAITNRNLGTNHGHVAWQRTLTPKIFHIREDPLDEPAYPCFVVWRDGGVAIADLRFDVGAGRVVDARDGRDVGDEIEWATSGQRVLRGGQVARVDDIADRLTTSGMYWRSITIERKASESGVIIATTRERSATTSGARGTISASPARATFTTRSDSRATRWWSSSARGRSRRSARRSGPRVQMTGSSWTTAGASPAGCGGPTYAGGLVSPTVDYRPPGTSAIAFVLKGPARVDPPGGSVAGADLCFRIFDF